MHTSRVATAAAWLACAAALLVGLGPALTMSGSVPPMRGFYLFGLGGLLGLVACVTGALGLLRTRAASGRAGRSQALLGSLLGAAVVAVLLSAALPAGDLPPINDITTSPDDPPVFVAALSEDANRGRDMAYPGAEFAAAQRAAYPDLVALELAIAPSAAFDATEQAMQTLGLVVTRRDRAAGAIEGHETTSIFRFVDDVVIRIRPAGAGSRIDVRSKSRDGRGDLGANAERIRRLRDALAG